MTDDLAEAKACVERGEGGFRRTTRALYGQDDVVRGIVVQHFAGLPVRVTTRTGRTHEGTVVCAARLYQGSYPFVLVLRLGADAWEIALSTALIRSIEEIA